MPLRDMQSLDQYGFENVWMKREEKSLFLSPCVSITIPTINQELKHIQSWCTNLFIFSDLGGIGGSLSSELLDQKWFYWFNILSLCHRKRINTLTGVLLNYTLLICLFILKSTNS